MGQPTRKGAANRASTPTTDFGLMFIGRRITRDFRFSGRDSYNVCKAESETCSASADTASRVPCTWARFSDLGLDQSLTFRHKPGVILLRDIAPIVVGGIRTITADTLCPPVGRPIPYRSSCKRVTVLLEEASAFLENSSSSACSRSLTAQTPYCNVDKSRSSLPSGDSRSDGGGATSL